MSNLIMLDGLLSNTEDITSRVLGTGYYKFASPLGVDGLCKWTDTRLDILAIAARRPGTGQFRAFIQHAKGIWPTIYIWEVWNPSLDKILFRYGFGPIIEIQPDDEILCGFKWPAPSKYWIHWIQEWIHQKRQWIQTQPGSWRVGYLRESIAKARRKD